MDIREGNSKMSLNRVVVIGRLTRDPEMKYTTQGIAVAQLSIAVNRITKGEDGDYETDFFNVTAWRRTAEFASQYLTKGRLISVDGRLQQRKWVDQQSGQNRSIVEIVADNIESLDRKPDGEGGAPMSSQQPSNYDEPAGGSQSAPPPAREPRAAAPAPARQNARAAAPAPAAYADDNDEADPFADE